MGEILNGVLDVVYMVAALTLVVPFAILLAILFCAGVYVLLIYSLIAELVRMCRTKWST